MGRWPGLVRCDSRGCAALVEPHVLRCEACRRDHGEHPDAWGRPGRYVKPRPPRKEGRHARST